MSEFPVYMEDNFLFFFLSRTLLWLTIWNTLCKEFVIILLCMHFFTWNYLEPSFLINHIEGTIQFWNILDDTLSLLFFKARVVYNNLKIKFLMNTCAAITVGCSYFDLRTSACSFNAATITDGGCRSQDIISFVYNGCKHVGKANEIILCSICDEIHHSLKTQS